jgi:Kef-type K+ transport system membrane component KefB
MQDFGPYVSIIAGAVIILLSFFFGAVAKRTNMPSVLLLIALGVGIQYLLRYLGIEMPDLFSALEMLGIVGLIMIVLEAALDLKLQRKKLGTIIRSFVIALLGLGVSMGVASFILFEMIPGLTWAQALIYATPLSILSSAIIIPSVTNLPEAKKEFHIYESTFSDILGIMLFYFLIGFLEPEIGIDGMDTGHASGSPVGAFFLNLLLTIVIALISSYVLLYLFQKIRERAKLFVLISVLLLMYSVAKLLHLSPLIIILIFGLAVSNSRLFFRGPLRKMIHPEKFKEMEHGLHGLTAETSFVVRTFFFVIFGVSIVLASLLSLDVLIVSMALIGSIYVIRWILMRIVIGRHITPQLWIVPRGLITILLFYAIPPSLQTELFDPGILLFIIIATGLIMTTGLISFSLAQHAAAKHEGHVKPIPPPIPGTAFTPTIVDPKASWPRRLIQKIRRWFDAKIWQPIAKHPTYRKTMFRFLRFFRAFVRALGVQPILSPESKGLRERVKSVLRSTGTGNLNENTEYQGLKNYVRRTIFENDTLEGILFDIILFVLIILSVAIVMIQSVSGIHFIWKGMLYALEWMITIVFTIEYILRIWTAANAKKYVLSFYGIVDLLAILPLFLELLFTNVYSLGVIRVLRLLRIFRVLKLVHFVGEAHVLVRGLKANAHKIVVFLFFVIIVCTVMGAVMFVIEGPSHGFSSIPRGVYWAVVTLTTVGYGDIHPITPIGQFIAMVLMVLGYGVIAIPTGLIAAGVSSAVRKEEAVHQVCPQCMDPEQPKTAAHCAKCGSKLSD